MKKLLALVAVFALVAFAAPAFAANPFVDVPMNHWAYDAISQLAAKGIIQGYPDGTYRGNHPMTRYEMSMLVARALATVDMEKASKEDVEMLKKLVVEFKDELEALGVRVDALDERVAVLEENLGGWKFWGELRLDAKWADEENGPHAVGGDTDFDLNRYRFWISKQIDDKTKVTMRVGKDSANNNVDWQYYFATIQLPWDSSLMAGLWNFDWEDEAGLYIDNDPWVTNLDRTGFYWRKNLEKGDITLFAAHAEEDAEAWNKEKKIWVANTVGAGDFYNYGARFNFNVNDKFRIALSGIYTDYDSDGTARMTYSSRLWDGSWNDPASKPSFEYYDYGTYWADFGITFTPGFEFKGAYYMQDHDGPNNVPQFDDSPNAYKAIIDVSQDTLKFTSLWIEYAKFDPHFHTANSPWDFFGAELTPNLTMPAVSNVWETEVLFVSLEQKWSDKWATFQRYGQFDHSLEGYASRDWNGSTSFDITNWSIGVQYWYTPTVLFELAYDDVDYDEGWTDLDGDLKDDSLVRFRTWIFF